jgi:hypothetical protein
MYERGTSMKQHCLDSDCLACQEVNLAPLSKHEINGLEIVFSLIVEFRRCTDVKGLQEYQQDIN